MIWHVDLNEDIAGRSAVLARFTFAAKTQQHPGVDTGRDRNVFFK